MQPRPFLNLGNKNAFSHCPEEAEGFICIPAIPHSLWGQEPSQTIPEQAGCACCTSKEELSQTPTSDVGSCWEELWLQGHFQRLRVDFMAGWGRNVPSEDGEAEGMQT